MPRVTQAHVDARRREILLAAHRCFARAGFHQTTMEDIAAAAGLSAGALYRYFDGKEALIEALGKMGRSQKQAALERLATGDGVAALGAMVGGVLQLLEMEGADDAVRLDVRLWGEALSHQGLRQVLEESLESLRAPLGDFIRTESAAGRMCTDADPDALAGVIVAMLTGIELQRAVDPEVDVRELSRAVTALLRGLSVDRSPV